MTVRSIIYSDLAVGQDDLSFSDAAGNQILNPQQGETVTIKVRAQNLSMVDTTGEVTVKLYDGDVDTGSVIGTATIPAKLHNSSTVVTLPWRVGYGTDNNPVAGYQDGYKVISAAIEYTANLGWYNRVVPIHL